MNYTAWLGEMESMKMTTAVGNRTYLRCRDHVVAANPNITLVGDEACYWLVGSGARLSCALQGISEDGKRIPVCTCNEMYGFTTGIKGQPHCFEAHCLFENKCKGPPSGANYYTWIIQGVLLVLWNSILLTFCIRALVEKIKTTKGSNMLNAAITTIAFSIVTVAAELLMYLGSVVVPIAGESSYNNQFAYVVCIPILSVGVILSTLNVSVMWVQVAARTQKMKSARRNNINRRCQVAVACIGGISAILMGFFFGVLNMFTVGAGYGLLVIVILMVVILIGGCRLAKVMPKSTDKAKALIRFILLTSRKVAFWYGIWILFIIPYIFINNPATFEGRNSPPIGPIFITVVHGVYAPISLAMFAIVRYCAPRVALLPLGPWGRETRGLSKDGLDMSQMTGRTIQGSTQWAESTSAQGGKPASHTTGSGSGDESSMGSITMEGVEIGSGHLKKDKSQQRLPERKLSLVKEAHSEAEDPEIAFGPMFDLKEEQSGHATCKDAVEVHVP